MQISWINVPKLTKSCLCKCSFGPFLCPQSTQIISKIAIMGKKIFPALLILVDYVFYFLRNVMAAINVAEVRIELEDE